MYIKEEKRIPIKRGINDCFFESKDICHHIHMDLEKCPMRTCEFYKTEKLFKT